MHGHSRACAASSTGTSESRTSTTERRQDGRRLRVFVMSVHGSGRFVPQCSTRRARLTPRLGLTGLASGRGQPRPEALLHPTPRGRDKLHEVVKPRMQHVQHDRGVEKLALVDEPVSEPAHLDEDGRQRGLDQ